MDTIRVIYSAGLFEPEHELQMPIHSLSDRAVRGFAVSVGRTAAPHITITSANAPTLEELEAHLNALADSSEELEAHVKSVLEH